VKAGRKERNNPLLVETDTVATAPNAFFSSDATYIDTRRQGSGHSSHLLSYGLFRNARRFEHPRHQPTQLSTALLSLPPTAFSHCLRMLCKDKTMLSRALCINPRSFRFSGHGGTASTVMGGGGYRREKDMPNQHCSGMPSCLDGLRHKHSRARRRQAYWGTTRWYTTSRMLLLIGNRKSRSTSVSAAEADSRLLL
jgi:hypothetical protein